MRPILEIKEISKKFVINHDKQPYLSIRDKFSNFLSPSKPSEEFWALKNISFDINPGESVGLIGKNGAGKSTFLKILSKITPPTSGKIISRGRIASLLEVGTGFHPELTGRENVFLNGSILGMKRSEIKSKFDDIVSFSGVEKFLDTPLKHYSSGMQLRLAFSVSAFLDPDILIIDEVLAVGDADFQKKCITKMTEISRSGKTILFVSHNMAALKNLCKKAVYLKEGLIEDIGSASKVVENYLSQTHKAVHSGLIPEKASSINTGNVKFKRIVYSRNEENDMFGFGEEIGLTIELDSDDNYLDFIFDIRVNTIDGIEVLHSMNKYSTNENFDIKKGKNVVSCRIVNNLQPGQYSVTIGFHLPSGATLEFVENILDINVLNVSRTAKSDFIYNFKMGIVRAESKWLRIE
jgi:lipopolysaccharide transport system ATP-binding protein